MLLTIDILSYGIIRFGTKPLAHKEIPMSPVLDRVVGTGNAYETDGRWNVQVNAKDYISGFVLKAPQRGWKKSPPKVRHHST